MNHIAIIHRRWFITEVTQLPFRTGGILNTLKTRFLMSVKAEDAIPTLVHSQKNRLRRQHLKGRDRLQSCSDTSDKILRI